MGNLKEWGELYLVDNHKEIHNTYAAIIVGLRNQSGDIVYIYQTAEDVSEYLVYFLHNGEYEFHTSNSFSVDWDLQITEGVAPEYRINNEAEYLSGIIKKVDNKKIKDAISKFKTEMQNTKINHNNVKENLKEQLMVLKKELDIEVITMTGGTKIGLDDIRFGTGKR